MQHRAPALLALEDGRTFRGKSWAAEGEVCGEIVFNTSMTGYQEVLTDPSYAGQIVCMTYPLIGNYGVNETDSESARPWVEGFVVREASRIVGRGVRRREARQEGASVAVALDERVTGIAVGGHRGPHQVPAGVGLHPWRTGGRRSPGEGVGEVVVAVPHAPQGDEEGPGGDRAGVDRNGGDLGTGVAGQHIAPGGRRHFTERQAHSGPPHPSRSSSS